MLENKPHLAQSICTGNSVGLSPTVSVKKGMRTVKY